MKKINSVQQNLAFSLVCKENLITQHEQNVVEFGVIFQINNPAKMWQRKVYHLGNDVSK